MYQAQSKHFPPSGGNGTVIPINHIVENLSAAPLSLVLKIFLDTVGFKECCELKNIDRSEPNPLPFFDGICVE
jgi:hypothetical protein